MKMKTLNKNHFVVLLKIIILVLFVGLIFLCTSLIKQYRQIQRLDYVQSARAAHSLSKVRGNGPVTINDVAQIQTWMTFDYVNHVFNLPPDYIKSKLNISDQRYPRLTIAQYSTQVGLNKVDVLLQLQGYIKEYLTNPAK